MENEVTETAKAVQEAAKTTGKAIETTDKIGRFFSRVMNESVEAACGMVADTLRYKRWERQVQFMEKAERLIADKKLSEIARPIKPKLALPVFHHASLEDNETLHDLWVKLFVTALDPDCEEPRSSFVDIIRQLEPIDVRVLKVIYDAYISGVDRAESKQADATEDCMKAVDDQFDRKLFEERQIDYRSILIGHNPAVFPCSDRTIQQELKIDSKTYRTVIDNLIRQRLSATFIDYKYIEHQEVYDRIDELQIPIDQGYDQVCMTQFGVAFVEASLSIPMEAPHDR